MKGPGGVPNRVKVTDADCHAGVHETTCQIKVTRGFHLGSGEPPATDVPQDIRDALRAWLDSALPAREEQPHA